MCKFIATRLFFVKILVSDSFCQSIYTAQATCWRFDTVGMFALSDVLANSPKLVSSLKLDVIIKMFEFKIYLVYRCEDKRSRRSVRNKLAGEVA